VSAYSHPDVTLPPVRARLVSVLTRRYPLYSGRGRLANHPTVQWFAGNPSGVVWADVDGGKLLADLQEHIGRAAFYCRDLDPKVSWICRRLVQEGDTVLDIGANIGLMTLLLARLTGPSGTVIAWEPNPALFDRLQWAVRENGRSHVAVRNEALGDKPGTLELRVPRHNQGNGSLTRYRNDLNSDVFNVSVTTLDASLSQPVHFIKLDVEGFEPQVLRGATRILRESRPLILIENNGDDRTALEILQSNGYRLLYVPKCLSRMRLEHYDGSTEANDFLAVPSGRFDSLPL
jgi:FkbM family methyltransferase